MAEEHQQGETQRQGAEEWKAIFQQVESQVRKEAARAVGVSEDADWTTIGRQTDDTVRRNVARNVGVEEDANWEVIGRHLEKTGRSGVARFVGTSEDADWATIGQTVEERMRVFLDNLFGRTKPQQPQDDIVDPWTKGDE
jgi:hypothetical protein